MTRAVFDNICDLIRPENHVDFGQVYATCPCRFVNYRTEDAVLNPITTRQAYITLESVRPQDPTETNVGLVYTVDYGDADIIAVPSASSNYYKVLWTEAINWRTQPLYFRAMVETWDGELPGGDTDECPGCGDAICLHISGVTNGTWSVEPDGFISAENEINQSHTLAGGNFGDFCEWASPVGLVLGPICGYGETGAILRSDVDGWNLTFDDNLCCLDGGDDCESSAILATYHADTWDCTGTLTLNRTSDATDEWGALNWPDTMTVTAVECIPATSSITSSVDSYIAAHLGFNHRVDSFLDTGWPIYHGVDSYLVAVRTLVHGVDSYLITSGEIEHGVDSWLIFGGELSHDVDSYLST